MAATLEDLKRAQRDFDLSHSAGKGVLYREINNEDQIHELMNLAICLSGEVGEFCNILKKCYRGDFSLAQAKGDLSEELSDVFIYILKISNQFNIDIESEVLDKIKKNRSRFMEI